MTDNNYKELIITELLNGAYEKFEWTRDNFDFEAKIDDYKLLLISNRETIALIIDGVPYNSNHHVIIDMEDDKRIPDLYSKVFDYVNKVRQDAFLKGFYEILKN